MRSKIFLLFFSLFVSLFSTIVMIPRNPSVQPNVINSIQVENQTLMYSATPLNDTSTVTATMTPSPTSNVSQQDILAVYKDLVEANKSAVEAAKDTLNLVMTLVSIVTALLVGAGIFSVIKVQGVVQKATSAEEKVNFLEKKIDQDTSILEQLHNKYSVDQYAMRLFSNDTTSVGARKELLELSKNQDPIIRRECLKVFASMPDRMENWNDEKVFSRIIEMSDRDSEGAVRLEAKYTHSHWIEKRKNSN